MLLLRLAAYEGMAHNSAGSKCWFDPAVVGAGVPFELLARQTMDCAPTEELFGYGNKAELLCQNDDAYSVR